MIPHRIHLVYVGKARELPRFAEVYADRFPAWCGSVKPGRVPTVGRLANPTREAAGIPPEAQPAAVRGGA